MAAGAAGGDSTLANAGPGRKVVPARDCHPPTPARAPTMDLRDRLPQLLALPLALAFGGAVTTPGTPTTTSARTPQDTVVAWRIAGRAANAHAERDTTPTPTNVH